MWVGEQLFLNVYLFIMNNPFGNALCSYSLVCATQFATRSLWLSLATLFCSFTVVDVSVGYGNADS